MRKVENVINNYNRKEIIMNIIPELTTEVNIQQGIQLKIEKQILQLFRENEVSVAQARVLFEYILTDMEKTPLR